MGTKEKFHPQKGAYSTKEAAAYLGVNPATIRKLVKRGLLRRSHAVAKLILNGEDVETFMSRTS